MAVDGVGLGVGATGEVSGGGRGEVAASGEAPDADVVGPDAEVRSVKTDVADGPLRVPEFDGVVVFGAEAVFENVGADTEVVEPGGDLSAFVVHGEIGVAAAGADDDAGGRFVGTSGRVEGEGWFVSVGGALCTGGAVGPQKDGFFGGLCGLRG